MIAHCIARFVVTQAKKINDVYAILFVPIYDHAASTLNFLTMFFKYRLKYVTAINILESNVRSCSKFIQINKNINL